MQDHEPKPAARARVLVVEDDGATAFIVKHLVDREGFEAEVVRDGKAAAALVGKDPVPVLAIFDLLLPYVGGGELIRLVRADPSWGAVPIIVLTSKTGEQDAVAALDAGATDYVRKPFRPEELLARVRRCLRKPA